MATHRIHSDNEPLPTSGRVDYSADNINRLADQDMYPAAQRNTHTPSQPFIGADPTHDSGPQQRAEYPTETHPPGFDPKETESRFIETPGLTGTEESASTTPYAKPSIKDKVIGKTEELVGKIVHDPKLQAKGTIRSEVGKV